MISRSILRVGVVTLAVGAALVPLPPASVERWYSQDLYPALQAHVTPATNQIPIALFDVSVGVVLMFAAWHFLRLLRSRGLFTALGSAVVGLLTFSAVAYLAFLLLWGLNYQRLPLEDKLDFDEARITEAAAVQLAREAVARINTLYRDAHLDAPPGPLLQDAFVAAQARLATRRNAVPGVPKGSLLQTYFRWAAVDGMTNPFFLEIILNPEALPIELPFVLAHEWGHLAGYADESEANLIAWLTCLEGNALAQYSGWLSVYPHVIDGLPRAERRGIAEKLQPGPRQDLAAIAARIARSQPLVRNLARHTYDAYLRANRVEGGIASYDRVVRLILGAGAGHGWAPRARPVAGG